MDLNVEGSGLGLTITQDILEAYGGNFELERSKDLGGLCARIKIPAGFRNQNGYSAR